VRVPGKLKRSAAVAWWRKEAERRKYVGKDAKYTRTETTEIVRCKTVDGGRILGMKGRSVTPMWTPKVREARDINSVKMSFEIPSTA
jgi:hypothetical protein